jgi:AraC-like DNA-binding protein
VPIVDQSEILDTPQPAGRRASWTAAAAARSADGLRALERELEDQGVPNRALFKDAGIDPRCAERSDRALSHAERLALFRSATRLAQRPDTALRAGQRQRIADFGVYGYALATSTTFAEALRFGREHLELAGPVLRISFELQADRGIFRSHNPQALGSALPFVAEFWRSSMTTLLGHVLEAPFPSVRMTFPYQAPRHAAAYREVFCCPIEFGSDVMEWHFDAAVLGAACPNASAVTARICRDFCERVVSAGNGQTPLQREVRAICLENPGVARADRIATELGLSLRTFHRRLNEERVGFQALLDGVRRSIAVEYLENTTMPVEEVAWRVGFADASNFRKAFRRWTGGVPSAYRSPRERT